MSTLTESAFLLRATAVLDKLDIAIEHAATQADIDIESNRNGGMLEIELADHSKMVINIQAPMQEIWVAAKAGGFHFRYDEARNAWFDTREGEELYTVVARLITTQVQLPVMLSRS